MFILHLATPADPSLNSPLVLEPLQAVILLVSLAIYVAVTLTFRWVEAAMPIRNHLNAELAHVRATLELARGEVADHESRGSVSAEDRTAIRAAERLMQEAQVAIPPRRGSGKLWDAVTWSRGEEVGMLHDIREAERILKRFDPPERVLELLGKDARTLLDDVTMSASPAPLAGDVVANYPKAPRPGSERDWRAQLDEKLREVHEREVWVMDENLTEIMRSTWIMFLCIGMILACSAVLGHTYLFLGGAIGGLIGRMARVAQVTDSSTWVFEDTRAAKLIASPALGAVAGWTGVLLVSLTHIDLLGAGDPWIPKGARGQMEAFGIALLLGCSEPLLNRVLSSASRRGEDSASGKTPTASPGAPQSAPTG